MKHVIHFSPGDLMIQIIPKTSKLLITAENNLVRYPDEQLGFIIPVNIFFVDSVKRELCGVLEIGTIFYNENIKRDMIGEIFEEDTIFDIVVRRRSSKDADGNGPKIIQMINDVHMNRRELVVPEIGNNVVYRYYFTDSNDPWDIPIEKLNAMRPENQYIYDYAVSKAVKDLRFPIDNMTNAISELTRTITIANYNDNEKV